MTLQTVGDAVGVGAEAGSGGSRRLERWSVWVRFATAEPRPRGAVAARDTWAVDRLIARTPAMSRSPAIPLRLDKAALRLLPDEGLALRRL